MNPAISIPAPHRNDWLIGLAIAIGTIILGVLLIPIESPWSYNTDEAIELSRLFHTSLGFHLYSEIWSDHPPGWTWLLRGWTAIFGVSLLAAKGLALMMAAIGMLAFYWILRLFFDPVTAVFGIVLFSTTARFLPAINAATIDMPMLALSLIGMALFLYGLKNGSRWLVGASGVFFAYALTIKFFTTILIVTLFACSGILSRNIGGKEHLKLRWLWLLIIIAGFGLLMLTYWPFPHYHLVQFHTNARKFFGSETILKLLKRAWEKDYLFLILTAFSLLLVLTRLRSQIWRVLLPLVWLGLILLQFSLQRPVWWIYYPLIALPLSWIACLPFSKFLSHLRATDTLNIKNPRSLLPLLLLAIWLLPIGQVYIHYFREDAMEVAAFRTNPPIEPKQQLLESVLKFSNQNKWILTDDAMYALYTKTPIPPKVAVLSSKRILTEQLDDQFFIDILNDYRPEQIVWVRFPEILERPALQEALANKDYRSLPTSSLSMSHYVRADIWSQHQKS